MAKMVRGEWQSQATIVASRLPVFDTVWQCGKRAIAAPVATTVVSAALLCAAQTGCAQDRAVKDVPAASPQPLPSSSGGGASSGGAPFTMPPPTNVGPTAPPPAPAPAPAPVASTAPAPLDSSSSSARGNVAELQGLIHGSNLVELRTSYNGSYGASLLYYPSELTYYVALFEQKNFWRVIKTTDSARADSIYNDFVRQTVQLSAVEIRRTQLAAQKADLDRMIGDMQDHEARLQADLAVAQTQQSVVDQRQQQTQQEAKQLAAERSSAQAEIDSLRKRIADLQRQADSGLPKNAR